MLALPVFVDSDWGGDVGVPFEKRSAVVSSQVRRIALIVKVVTIEGWKGGIEGGIFRSVAAPWRYAAYSDGT
jgi:hypothetical protein